MSENKSWNSSSPRICRALPLTRQDVLELLRVETLPGDPALCCATVELQYRKYGEDHFADPAVRNLIIAAQEAAGEL
jgi:hypothetical protein